MYQDQNYTAEQYEAYPTEQSNVQPTNDQYDNSYYGTEQQPGENYYSDPSQPQQEETLPVENQYEETGGIGGDGVQQQHQPDNTNLANSQYEENSDAYKYSGEPPINYVQGEEESSTTYSENVAAVAQYDASGYAVENIPAAGEYEATPNYLESETDESTAAAQPVPPIKSDESDFDFSASAT